jgi:hypothetical protein
VGFFGWVLYCQPCLGPGAGRAEEGKLAQGGRLQVDDEPAVGDEGALPVLEGEDALSLPLHVDGVEAVGPPRPLTVKL